MFICESCSPEEVKWFFTLAMGVSFGPCECCHKRRECIDWHGNLKLSKSKALDSLDAYKYDI